MEHLIHSTSKTRSPLLNLPSEVKGVILEILREEEAIIDTAQAEEVREALMNERSKFVRVQDFIMFELEYK